MSTNREFLEKIRELNISCIKCLDSQMLWKNRNNNDDGLGWFIVVMCDRCNPEPYFLDYSMTSNLIINGTPIFNMDDNPDEYSIVRFPIVRKMYDFYISMKRRDF